MMKRRRVWIDMAKMKKVKKRRNEEEENNMSTIPDDLLLEILIRLPDIRSAIRSSLVCHGWSSLINSSHRCYFSSAFTTHLRSKTPPLRLLFHLSPNRCIFSPHQTPPPILLIQNLLPQNSPIQIQASTLVDSLPSFHNLCTGTLLAADGDVLLVKKSSSYYVYSPFTGLEVKLPDHPSISGDLFNCGLAIHPTIISHNPKLGMLHKKMRILLIFGNQLYCSEMTIFCSESWKWTQAMPLILLAKDQLVACNGILYHLNSKVMFLVVLNLFNDGHDIFRYFILPQRFYSFYYSETHLRVVMSKGRPRIAHLFRIHSDYLCLDVWEVHKDIEGEYVEPFVLVHHLEFSTKLDPPISLFLLGFHPSKDDHIFILLNRTICLLDLNLSSFLNVAEFLSDFDENMRMDLRLSPFVNPE